MRLFVLSLFLTTSVLSQINLDLDDERSQQALDSSYIQLLPYASVHIDSTRSLDLQGVQKQQMQSASVLESPEFSKDVYKYPVWLKIPFSPSEDENYQELTLGVYGGISFEIFELTNDTIYYVKGGYEERFFYQDESFKLVAHLQGLNKSPGYLFVKLNGQSDLPVDLRLYEKEYMELFTHRWNFNRRGYITYYAVLSAILFFTGLFFLARYFQFNEKYLLWYALYLILMGIFNLANFERTAHHMIFWEYFRLPRELQQLFRPVPWLFFCLYLRDILGIKPKSTFYGIYKWMFNAVVLSLVVCLMLFILRQVFRIPLLNQIYFYSLIPVSLASAVLAWKVNKGATSVHRFIGIGILVIALGSLIYFASGFFFPGRSNHLIIEIALLIELVFLNMAIGLKIKQTNQELLSTQKELVLAEQHNLEIQKQLNEQLQELVDQKTQKIVEKNEALIAEEKLKLAAEFDQKIATAELKALKAQMNPHFIFNCLNAIRALIQDGNSEKATDYLADFAAFIRKVLSYSEVKQITLEEELELCQLYLKMEQLRFVDGFEFEIKADEGTAIDFIMLPPMLLQPLLENAIWHGLLHKEGDRKVSIEIAQTDSEVICKITDNGVGRAFSAELQKSSSSRKSMGMKLFKERLEINNQLLDHQYNYEIIDKLNDEQSQGTQVKLYFQL